MEVHNATDVAGLRLGGIRNRVPKKHEHADGATVHAPKLPANAMGQLASSVSQMTKEGRETFREFMVEAKNALRDGSFDVNAFAEKAPDELKQVLNTRQVTIEKALEPLAWRANRMRRPK